MATVIQIKRSTGASAPAVSDLAEGELAYVQDRSNDGASAKLYIESVDSGGNAAIHEVGGKFYTDIVDGASATPADFLVGNGSTSGGTLKILEDTDNGSNFVGLKAPDTIASNFTLTLPTADGSNGQVLGTNGSGVLSFVSTTSSIAGASDTNISSASSGQILVHDGSDSFDNVSVSGDATLASNGALTIAANAVQVGNIDFFVDEDNMASNSDVKVPSQQSVKAYVDSQLTAQEVDFAGDSGTGAVDLDSQSLTIAGTANEIETSASGKTLTVGLPNNVTVGNNLTVTGNLTVNGTTTTVNSTTTTVDDPVFTLGGDSAPGSDDNKDRGIEFRYHNGSAAKVGFFGYDDSTNKFTFIADATNTSEVFSGSAGDVAFGGITATTISGSGLALSGAITSIDGSAPTAGQILIGNGSNSDMQLATLTMGEGLDITNADGSITLAGEDATTSNKGIASFASANFTVSSGAVSITAIDGGTF